LRRTTQRQITCGGGPPSAAFFPFSGRNIFGCSDNFFTSILNLPTLSQSNTTNQPTAAPLFSPDISPDRWTHTTSPIANMSAPQDFKSLQDGVQKSLVSTVRTVNRIAAEDLGFQRTVNPDVARQLEGTSGRMLALSNRLLQSAAKACGVKAPPKLEDGEDIDIHWRGVVDVVDSVLEKADTAMDEYTGLVKRKDPPTHADSGPKRQKSTGKVIRNANISKPQAKFDKQPDNFPSGPWMPTLASKPHATVPLEQSLVTFTSDNGAKQ
jgi:exosome complex exonuclease RRP6